MPPPPKPYKPESIQRLSPKPVTLPGPPNGTLIEYLGYNKGQFRYPTLKPTWEAELRLMAAPSKSGGSNRPKESVRLPLRGPLRAA